MSMFEIEVSKVPLTVPPRSSKSFGEFGIETHGDFVMPHFQEPPNSVRFSYICLLNLL